MYRVSVTGWDIELLDFKSGSWIDGKPVSVHP
jgi:hypothetical protein